MIFDWQPEYSVGVAEIDALHQQVFEKARNLHAAVLAGRPESTQAELLAALVAYTQTHFTAEESLMEASRYPDSARHKARHEALAQTLLAASCQGGAISVETLQSIKDLVTRHIDEEDHALGRHLAGLAGGG
jgi:hemerythrin